MRRIFGLPRFTSKAALRHHVPAFASRGTTNVQATIALSAGLRSSTFSKVVPKENLGVFTGMFRGSLGFISLPAPWIGAQLWERFNPRVPFIITAILAFISVIPAWFKFKLPADGSAAAEESL